MSFLKKKKIPQKAKHCNTVILFVDYRLHPCCVYVYVFIVILLKLSKSLGLVNSRGTNRRYRTNALYSGIILYTYIPVICSSNFKRIIKAVIFFFFF